MTSFLHLDYLFSKLVIGELKIICLLLKLGCLVFKDVPAFFHLSEFVLSTFKLIRHFLYGLLSHVIKLKLVDCLLLALNLLGLGDCIVFEDFYLIFVSFQLLFKVLNRIFQFLVLQTILSG